MKSTITHKHRWNRKIGELSGTFPKRGSLVTLHNPGVVQIKNKLFFPNPLQRIQQQRELGFKARIPLCPLQCPSRKHSKPRGEPRGAQHSSCPFELPGRNRQDLEGGHRTVPRPLCPGGQQKRGSVETLARDLHFKVIFDSFQKINFQVTISLQPEVC